MYLSHPLEKLWASDIEGNDLYPAVNKVWCVCAVNVKTKKEVRLRDYAEIISFFVEQKKLGCKFIFHNGIGYDAPALIKCCRVPLAISDIIDTMIMSMVYSPSLEGGHSLEAWGIRLGFRKTEWSDFTKWSKEQEDYCLNDAHLCSRVYVALRGRMLRLNFTDVGLDIEHRSWQLIQKQKLNGFAFDYQGASILYATVRQKEKEIEERILEIWPPELTLVFTGKNSYKKNGDPSKNYLDHCNRYDRVDYHADTNTHSCYSYVAFNIGSPPQRVQRLLELGWQPREFTKPSKTHPNGQPQPVIKGKLAPSLLEFVEETGHEGAQLIARWIDLNARGNMLNTWMEAYNHDTGCIHGSLWYANTLRYKHSDPNTANIPAVRVDKEGHPILGLDGVYTYESRALWGCRDPDNRSLVGVDAKGIQLRVLAHYLNNKEFIDAVLTGDPHSYNQQIGELATRSLAKTLKI